MKVTVLTTSYPMFQGDFTGNFVAGLTENLQKKEIDVTVVTPHAGGLQKEEEINGVKVLRFQYAPQSIQKLAYGYGIIGNLKASLLAKIELPLFLTAFFIKGLRYSKDADIIHANWTIPGLIAVLINIFHKKMVVLTVHGSDIEKMPTWLNRFILKRCHKVIAVSKYLADRCVELGKKRQDVYYIPNGITGIEDLLAVPLEKKDNKNVIAVGRLSEEKNFKYLVSEFLTVLKTIPEAKLTIAGDGPERDELKRIIKEAQAENSIQLVGQIRHSKLPELFSKCSIFAMPSKREGFGLVLAEAMAAGRASVVANNTALLDIANESNAVISSLENNSFANAITTLLEDSATRERLAKNARGFAQKNFSFDIVAKKVIDVYLSTQG